MEKWRRIDGGGGKGIFVSWDDEDEDDKGLIRCRGLGLGRKKVVGRFGKKGVEDG